MHFLEQVRMLCRYAIAVKCTQARTVIVVFETDLPVRPQPTYRYIYSGSAMQVGLREREQAAARAGLALHPCTHAAGGGAAIT